MAISKAPSIPLQFDVTHLKNCDSEDEEDKENVASTDNKDSKGSQNGNVEKLVNNLNTTMKKLNLHSNFVDLNPSYKEARHERAKKVANRWLKQLGEKLTKDVKSTERKIFNDQMNNKDGIYDLTYT